MGDATAGFQALGSWEPLPIGPASIDYGRSQLGKTERSILEALAEAYPAALTKEEVAAKAGYHLALVIQSSRSQRLKVRQIQATVIVSDRGHDVIAGKSNGIYTIGVTYGYGSRCELLDAGAGEICGRPSELSQRNTTFTRLSCPNQGDGGHQ